MHRMALMVFVLGCGDPATVAGSMSFVLGGTGGPGGTIVAPSGLPLAAGEEYLLSPRKAKITFTSVEFRDAANSELLRSELTDCNVTYDRSLAAGSTLLDCPIAMPAGDVASMKVYFAKAMEILISDPIAGIYSTPTAPTLYTTTPPGDFVPYTIMIGDGTSRATDVVFAAPITIAEGSAPQLYVTTDMIQTFQIEVNDDGTSLTAHPGNDPIAIFGSLSPGTSHYYSNSASLESYKIGSVNGFHALRIFYGGDSKPLFLMSPNTCGPDGPKGAWASAPIGGTVGGWLGTDASKNLAWAQPLTNTWEAYTAHYVMAERSTLGETTVLKCKETMSPPPPTDGLTYASGAPAIAAPDVETTLTLLAK